MLEELYNYRCIEEYVDIQNEETYLKATKPCTKAIWESVQNREYCNSIKLAVCLDCDDSKKVPPSGKKYGSTQYEEA